MRAVFNTPETHNLVVCTLCSCYPWSVLGLPPVWYKAPPYRSRAVIDPRGVLAEFGVTLPDDQEDPRLGFDGGAALSRHARAARRVPKAGARTQLADLVTRDSMIGTGLSRTAESQHERAAGSRRADGLRPGRAGKGRAVFPCRMGKARARRRRFPAAPSAPGTSTKAGMRAKAFRRPTISAASYYEIWITALETLLERHGFVDAATSWPRATQSMRRRRPKRVLKADMVPAVLAKGGPCDRPVETPPRFAAGDRVRTKNFNPTDHTRLPRYARAKRGVIEAVQGRLRLSRQQRPWQGREPAMGLHGRLRRRGDLGRGRRPDADRLASMPGRAILSAVMQRRR